MGFGANRAVAHGARGEAADDGRHRFDFVDRDRGTPELRGGLHPEQAAQRGEVGRLIVDCGRVFLENVVPLGPGGVLELEDGVGVEQVVFTLAAPLILAARIECSVGPGGALVICHGMAGGDLVGDLVETDTA